MYLSKVLVKGSACHNPYEIHRVLWRLFPEDTGAKRDFLFRIEQSDYAHAEILMQSYRLPESYSDMTRILACKEYNPILAAGDRLRFFVTANPIKTIDDKNGRNNAHGEPKKCRVPLIREDEQRTWIERKFGNVTLIESMKFKPAPLIRFRKNKENRMGKIQPVIFSGLLRVQIPDAFITLVKTGIGPAKSFGCGMLSLARA